MPLREAAYGKANIHRICNPRTVIEKKTSCGMYCYVASCELPVGPESLDVVLNPNIGMALLGQPTSPHHGQRPLISLHDCLYWYDLSHRLDRQLRLQVARRTWTLAEAEAAVGPHAEDRGDRRDRTRRTSLPSSFITDEDIEDHGDEFESEDLPSGEGRRAASEGERPTEPSGPRERYGFRLTIWNIHILTLLPGGQKRRPGGNAPADAPLAPAAVKSAAAAST